MFDLESFIQGAGYLGLAAVIFAESGVLIGIIFPGDSVLFTAGFLASRGYFNIWFLIGLCFIAAVLGDNFGYAFGRRVGPKIFTREDSWFFHKHHVERARGFYERHGKKTIVLARFMPAVRTLAPILAGVGNMHYRTFITYNALGGFLWAVCLPLLGYFLGNIIPGVDKYLIPIVLTIIIASMLPGFYHFWKDRRARHPY